MTLYVNCEEGRVNPQLYAFFWRTKLSYGYETLHMTSGRLGGMFEDEFARVC